MGLEREQVKIFSDDREASKAVARRIVDVVQRANGEERPAVLGLATGSTPINVYRELIRLHRDEGVDFSNVITFNLDEYWPIDPGSLQSYRNWMHENLFKHINIPDKNIHIPSGTIPEEEIEPFCRQYEEQIKQAGGIDLQLLGIGRSGHIGFNEPGSSPNSRTRLVDLDLITRKDAASDFFGEENVPLRAITMGVGSILAAREVCLLAFGEHKAAIIRRAVEGEVTDRVAASYLQNHPHATAYLDAASAADLTWIDTPWLLGPCEWTPWLQEHAVLWLARKLDKAILKLTEEDYVSHGLRGLLHSTGGFYDLNLVVFKRLMNTITGWPGGKQGGKRVLVLSPHPDDDVISMGGTLTRFTEQGHEVHVAYMVSGYLSVFDHVVLRHAEFVRGFNRIFGLTPEQTTAIEEHIERFIVGKEPGEMDSTEVREIKGLVRRTEANAAATFCGVDEEHTHFLNLPFYDSGRVEKLPLTDTDIRIVLDLYREVKPDLVFLAGDLSDPHGTHRQCLDAALTALEQYGKDAPQPEVWLYRGAWQEWEPEQIDMAVPLSPDELMHKRLAIFRHESQKDRAMFPGPFDSREFWQRAEERNQGTAQLYDSLGLPEYHAIEAFAKYPARGAFAG